MRQQASAIMIRRATARLALLAGCLASFPSLASSGVLVIDTVAGGGMFPNGSPALSIPLGGPRGVAIDPAGNILLTVSTYGLILKVDGDGVATYVAGTGILGYSGDGGPAASAQLNDPRGIAVDPNGNIFVADSWNNRVRRIDAVTGIITTYAGLGDPESWDDLSLGDGGPALQAYLRYPVAVTFDPQGRLLIVETWRARVRRVDPATGIITTVAGGGTVYPGDGGLATDAQLEYPEGIAVDPNGNIYIAEAQVRQYPGSSRIRRVDAATGVITTYAGGGLVEPGDGGPATSAALDEPRGLAFAQDGDLLISEEGDGRIRRVDAATGIISTIAFYGAYSMATDPAFNLYLARDGASRITRLDSVTFAGTDVAGNGNCCYYRDGDPATQTMFSRPAGVVADPNGNIYIVDSDSGRIRRVDAATGIVTTYAGGGTSLPGDGGPATSARLYPWGGIVLDGAGNLIFSDTGNRRVRKVDASTGVITTVIGNGYWSNCVNGVPATQTCIRAPEGLAIDGAGNLYVSDGYRGNVRKVDAATGIISLYAGQCEGCADGSFEDGIPATSAYLDDPSDVAVDGASNLLIADAGISRIRKVDAVTGIITTVAGGGPCCSLGDGGPATAAFLNQSEGVGADGAGNIFIADTRNSRVRRVDASTGIITTVASMGRGFGGDGFRATNALLNHPGDVFALPGGELLIADTENLRIRRVWDHPCDTTDVDGDGSLICDDCDDQEPARFPGNPELCNGIDEDCDLVVPPNEADADWDGFRICAGDCDDADPNRHPGVPELCNQIDDDCDGTVPREEMDLDGDGVWVCRGDCNDADPNILGAVVVSGLGITGIPGGIRITWIDQAATAGAPVVYDSYSGRASLLRPSGDWSTGSCLAEDLPAASMDYTGPGPAVGEAFYFVFRAQTSCLAGTGTYGNANRDTEASASVNPCH